MIQIEDVKNVVKSEPFVDEFLVKAVNDVLHQGKEDYSNSRDGANAAPNENSKGHSNKKLKPRKKPLLAPPAGTRR
ncbi:hypothetical protein GOP47_0031217 [Adiantum capillus-veneris]|nr:hypothetical protein GOP47_0031217 [Adiantum capillus-veneris]